MQNAFLPFETDFEAWIEAGYETSAPATEEYLRFLADPEDEREPRPGGLWRHQWEALLRVIYSREVMRRGFWEDGLLTNIVTGGGKTALIAATMVWLRLAHDIRRFLILCPNLIVRDRLETDLRSGKVFVDRDLIPPGGIVAADDFALTTLGGSAKATSGNLFGANVVLANIHQFYRSNATGRQNLWSLLEADRTPFAVFNDEAHNTPAPEYDATLRDLHNHDGFCFRLDSTATPERADGRPVDSRMIFEYDIPAALNDQVIATPVVYQPDIETVELTYTDVDTGETRRVEEIDWDEVERAGLSATQWVTDSKPMSQQISIALNRLEEARRNARGLYQPILFVVAVCKADARAAKRMLEEDFRVPTLIVTEDQDEQARLDAAAIGASKQYKAVVSVAMLREGWDVPEVSVILLLRKFGSKVYGPQVVGRGLRRVRHPGIELDDPQICAIVDHPKLQHEWLWELLKARVRSNVGVDQQFDEKKEVGEPPPSQEIVNPKMTIKIPEPLEVRSLVLDPVTGVSSPQPAFDWLNQLNMLDYERDAVEITDVTLRGVTGQQLSPDGWTQHGRAPGDTNIAEGDRTSHMTVDELRDHIRERLHGIAEAVVVEAGYSALLRRHVYPPLLKHVCERWLEGLAIAFADKDALRRAEKRLNHLEAALLARTDIVSGMVEHGTS